MRHKEQLLGLQMGNIYKPGDIVFAKLDVLIEGALFGVFKTKEVSMGHETQNGLSFVHFIYRIENWEQGVPAHMITSFSKLDTIKTCLDQIALQTKQHELNMYGPDAT